MRFLAAGLLLAVIAGCSPTLVSTSSPVTPSPAGESDLFDPVSMRIHPIFTQVKSWTGRNAADGIEAVLEFQDRFGDTTKASGTVLFELYSYRTGFPDHRGARQAEPWIASLDSVDSQKLHWRSEIGAYDFLLALPTVSTSTDYVLTAMFEPPSGRRLFAQTIIIGQKKTSHPATRPALDLPE
ncbi:MAG TPA: hypothetical protein VL992_17910 [Tepidisphaeraceae bacterium]|nr:hypothetical protein [Tepidisphaeraceae bacterium]